MMIEYFKTFISDKLLNISYIQMAYIAVCIFSFVLYRIFLCLTIHSDAKEREVKSRNLWTVLTFIFGVIIPIIYAIVNRKNKAVKQLTSKNVFLVISIILIILSSIGGILYNLSNTGEFEHILNPKIAFDETTVVVYKNDKGRKVRYDKMGNEYTFSQCKNISSFLYYDENGVAYKFLGHSWTTLFNTKTRQKYFEEDYFFFINDDGYLCIYDNLDDLHEYENDIYYDDYGNLYYSDICFVNWDKNGNVVFPEFVNEFNDITYDSIVNS